MLEWNPLLRDLDDRDAARFDSRLKRRRKLGESTSAHFNREREHGASQRAIKVARDDVDSTTRRVDCHGADCAGRVHMRAPRKDQRARVWVLTGVDRNLLPMETRERADKPACKVTRHR